ncbi:hypothetical protein V6N13_037083 [Hibiscus sabdariffa]
MCKCRSHGTFPLFGLQSSHLNICYYHQDLHRRPLRPGSRPGFYGDRRALLLMGPGTCPDGRRVVGHRNPASGSSRIASSAYQKWPTWSSRFRGTAQRSIRAVLPISSLRIGRGRCAPDASNHWLYPIELAKGSSYPEGNFGGNQLLEGSIPYTQVRRTICTSISLRASTRVSSGFAPLRHSSPSFGSRQACPHSNPSQKIKVGRRCTREGSRQSASLRLTGFLTR